VYLEHLLMLQSNSHINQRFISTPETFAAATIITTITTL
jgi:hypothetical protein